MESKGNQRENKETTKINDDDKIKKSKKIKETSSDVTSSKKQNKDKKVLGEDSDNEVLSSKKQKKKVQINEESNSEVKSPKKHKKKSNKKQEDVDIDYEAEREKLKKNNDSNNDLLSDKKYKKKKKNKEDESNGDTKSSKKKKKSKKLADETSNELSDLSKNDDIDQSLKHKKKSKKKSKKHHHSDNKHELNLSEVKIWKPAIDSKTKKLIDELMEHIDPLNEDQGENVKKELDKQYDERQKRMEIFLYKKQSVPDENTLKPEELDNEINATKNELLVFEKGLELKQLYDRETFDETNKAVLIGKIDYMRFRLMEKENTIDALAYKLKMVYDKYSGIQQALEVVERFDVDKEKLKKYRSTFLKLRNEMNEATDVIEKVQNMAHELLPVNISKHCKKVDDTKKRLVEMQDSLMEKKYFTKKKIIINEKKIEALTIATVAETAISKLLEVRLKEEVEKYVYHELRSIELDKIITECEEGLILINMTLEEAQAVVVETELPNVKDKEQKEEHKKKEIKKGKIKELKENNKMVKEHIKGFKNALKEIEAEYEAIKKNNKAENEFSQLLLKVEKTVAERRRLAEILQSEKVLRKTYYNQVEDMKGSIRVFCRVRPMSSTEIKNNNEICFEFPDIYTVIIKKKYKKQGEKNKEYLFDHVYPMQSTQEEIFKDIDRLIEIVFTGFNVCIFAYGQTGSGKTYTLIGSMDPGPNMGIVPRSFNKIFDLINKNQKFVETECNFCMVELYNDKLLDLMKSGAEYSEKLEIKKNEQGMIIVPGLVTCFAKNVNDMVQYFHAANKNRHIASTKMNSESSRSHLILTILFTFTEKTVKKKTFGKFSIIDLAGSERSAKSGVTGINLLEATAINKALTSLGDVISALTQTNKGFVPYRNHKLTQLMQDSLGGTAKTLMIVNLSPVDFNLLESVSSLAYATRVKTITNEGVRVTDFDEVKILKDVLEKLLRGDPVTIP